MVLVCFKSPKPVTEYKDNALATGPFLKGHNNFDAGCDITILPSEAKKTLKRLKIKPKPE
jgi:hypothetical protein